MSEWDCIVVGAGIVGSWTAYHLAAAGKRTLLLEQFMLPNSRGSSSGHSRLLANTYTKSCYLESMHEVSKMWHDMEQQTGEQLMKKTGCLIIQHPEEPGPLKDIQDALDMYDIPYENLSENQVSNGYPCIHNAENKPLIGLLDRGAAMLFPNRCLRVIQEEFRKLGGVIKDDVKVTKIVPGTQATLITPKGSYRANKLILTVGPWCNDLLKPIGINLPTKTLPGLSVYFQVRQSHLSDYSPEHFPSLSTYTDYKPDKYRFILMFPSVEYPGMVKLVTRGEPTSFYCHPDDRDQQPNDYMVDILAQFVRDYLPGVDPTPRIKESCMYTLSPDGDFILDRHPVHSNVIIGAGMSGHGFCRAPVTGKLLMELAYNKTTSYTVAPYSLKRFLKSKL